MVESASFCLRAFGLVLKVLSRQAVLTATCQELERHSQTFSFTFTHSGGSVLRKTDSLAKMAVSLGKRKREDDEGDFDDKTENDVALKALFQKAFEGRFKPLPPSETRALHEEPPIFDAGSVDSDESEWDGLSEDEERVEIFDHDSSRALSLTDENRERRSFMASLPFENRIDLD